MGVDITIYTGLGYQGTKEEVEPLLENLFPIEYKQYQAKLKAEIDTYTHILNTCTKADIETINTIKGQIEQRKYNVFTAFIDIINDLDTLIRCKDVGTRYDDSNKYFVYLSKVYREFTKRRVDDGSVVVEYFEPFTVEEEDILKRVKELGYEFKHYMGFYYW